MSPAGFAPRCNTSVPSVSIPAPIVAHAPVTGGSPREDACPGRRDDDRSGRVDVATHPLRRWRPLWRAHGCVSLPACRSRPLSVP
jgi:hypothetical protein